MNIYNLEEFTHLPDGRIQYVIGGPYPMKSTTSESEEVVLEKIKNMLHRMNKGITGMEFNDMLGRARLAKERRKQK